MTERAAVAETLWTGADFISIGGTDRTLAGAGAALREVAEVVWINRLRLVCSSAICNRMTVKAEACLA